MGRVQEEGRVNGVRNHDGRAEETAEIGIGKTSVRKKTQGQLPRPLMAGAGLGVKELALGADSQQATKRVFPPPDRGNGASN